MLLKVILKLKIIYERKHCFICLFKTTLVTVHLKKTTTYFFLEEFIENYVH